MIAERSRVRAEELRASRQPFVMATVVRAERPTSAKPGDSAVVLPDGTIVGFVGGECAEASVQVQALAALDRGEAVLLRVTPEAPVGAVPTAEPGAVTVHNPCLSGGTLEIFLEPVIPPPLVAIHGDAPIARAVAGLAERLGYAVAAWPADAPPRDAAAVVVASHGRGEVEVLQGALAAGVPYIGLVASARRGAGVLAALDVSDADRARIHTPAGLDIGARTPEEVALAILAEIVATRPRSDERPAVGSAATAAAPTAAAPTAVDPVCGMTVAMVEGGLHLDHEGARYWFCGSGCRQAFAADPGTFLTR